MALIDLFLFFQGYFINTLRPIQNGRNFVDNIFTYFFPKEVLLISIKISLNFVPEDLIINITALVHIILLPSRRQVIVWTNESLITDAYIRHLASMS